MEQDYDAIERMFDVNVHGIFRTVQVKSFLVLVLLDTPAYSASLLRLDIQVSRDFCDFGIAWQKPQPSFLKLIGARFFNRA